MKEKEEKQLKVDAAISLENQIIIEEKQAKLNGEINIVQYVRGNFLGKVTPPTQSHLLGRICKVLWVY